MCPFSWPLGGHVRGGSLVKPVRGGADWHGARSTGIDRLDVASGGRQHSLSFILWSILTTLTHTHLHQCSVSLVFISQRTPSGLQAGSIHELRRHRETLRPAGQHSRRGVAPVCSLERVRPLERDTGPSEGLRLRFGKEKTLARDNSVGMLGAGGHRGRIPPSAGPEGSHERVPSAQICCELRTGRLFRESNGRLSEAVFAPSPSIWLQPVRSGGLQALGEASPRAPPCRETCTAPSRMFTSHARRSSLRRKKICAR